MNAKPESNDEQTRRPTKAPAYAPLYSSRACADSEQQATRLEALRYKWGGYRAAVRWMQRLGDLGRRWGFTGLWR